MSEPGSEGTRRSTAATLRRLAEDRRAPRISIADLLSALSDHGFGLLLLLLALPNAVPGPLIPGFSVPFALGIAALGLQLALGMHTPRLPRRLQRLSMDGARFRRMVDRTEPLLLRLERWLKFRPSTLTDGPGERLVGVTLIALSAVLALPVPFGNMPVALSIIVIALGQLEADGAALLAGIVAGLAATLWNTVLIFAGAELLHVAERLS
ncbi:MAG TPA: exopolysaccharide biosynthesis protein [Stellaceae bacterium]|nr:exopolysaccharide biosynthesis protein [Stellaceae bacterium]